MKSVFHKESCSQCETPVRFRFNEKDYCGLNNNLTLDGLGGKLIIFKGGDET